MVCARCQHLELSTRGKCPRAVASCVRVAAQQLRLGGSGRLADVRPSFDVLLGFLPGTKRASRLDFIPGESVACVSHQRRDETMFCLSPLFLLFIHKFDLPDVLAPPQCFSRSPSVECDFGVGRVRQGCIAALSSRTSATMNLRARWSRCLSKWDVGSCRSLKFLSLKRLSELMSGHPADVLGCASADRFSLYFATPHGQEQLRVSTVQEGKWRPPHCRRASAYTVEEGPRCRSCTLVMERVLTAYHNHRPLTLDTDTTKPR